MIDISLDLETWGKRPGFDLRSIGACVFDPVKWIAPTDTDGALQTFYIATDNPIDNYEWDGPGFRLPVFRYPLKRDPETVAWWADQSPEAQAAFSNPVDLRDALLQFAIWLEQLSPVRPFDFLHYPDGINPHLRIWSHGAAFDPPILAEAYHACGLPVPWHYRAPRDTRTLFDIAGIDDHSAWMSQYNVGTAHHALDDAIAQARCICAAWDKVAGWRERGEYSE